MNFSVFEIGMLVCFGISWPVSIYQSLKSKSTKGKSIFFLFAIQFGYIFGIVHKIIHSRDIVMVLYIVNFIMISADILIYFINRRRENLLKIDTSEQDD